MANILIAMLFTLSAHAADTLGKRFPKAEFQVGDKRFHAYIADTDENRQQGLMFVKKLEPDTGMLFVFEEQQFLGFWMKNTVIPLSIGFFDQGGKLVDVQEMNTASSLMSTDIPRYQSAKPALFALEMQNGWFAKNGLKPGVRLKLTSTSPSKLLSAKLPK